MGKSLTHSWFLRPSREAQAMTVNTILLSNFKRLTVHCDNENHRNDIVAQQALRRLRDSMAYAGVLREADMLLAEEFAREGRNR